MPAVGFYLSREELEAVRTRARTEGVSVSAVIRRALRQALGLDDRRAARRRVVEALRRAPLGTWEAVARARGRGDAGRP